MAEKKLKYLIKKGIEEPTSPLEPSVSDHALHFSRVECHKQRYLCRVERKNGKYGGYKKDILTENLTDRDNSFLICGICEGIMREACFTSSGVQFCSCCEVQESPIHVSSFKKKLEKSRPKPRTPSVQTPNVAVREMVNSLKCSCPLIDRGCEWLGTLKDCEDHLDACGCVLDQCRLGCRVVLQRSKLRHHEMESCPEKDVMCEHCNKLLRYSQLSKHLEACLHKTEVACEECDTVMCYTDMTRHLEQDCVENKVKCPFAKYKCEVGLLKRKYLSQHLEEKRIEHLELKLNAMELKLNAMEGIIEKQNAKMKYPNPPVYYKPPDYTFL